MNPLHPHLQTLGWALLHFLWQGCLLWLLAALAFRLTARRDPQTRYLLGLGFLGLALASPVITGWMLHPGVLPPPLPSAGESWGMGPGAAPMLIPLPLIARVRLGLAPALPWILGGWALGAGFLALRLAGGWLWLQRLKARMEPLEADWERRLRDLAERMGLRRAFRTGSSRDITSPLVIGWIRPVLLMPASLLTGMDPLCVEALLAHEVAHLRRHDVLFNWLQCAVEVLLFYHPAVWWLSRRTRLERECCCDDAAVAYCGDPLRYAESLDQLDDLQSLHLIPAQAAHGANLMYRITRLLSPKSSTPRPFFAMPLVALLTAGAFALSAHSPKAEPAQSSPAPQAPAKRTSPKAQVARPSSQPTPEAKPAEKQPPRSISFELGVQKDFPLSLNLYVTNATRAELELALARIEALAKSNSDQVQNRGNNNRGNNLEGRWELKPHKGSLDDLMSFQLKHVTPAEARQLF